MHQNPYANSPLVVALRKKSYYKAWRCTRLLSTAGSFLLLLLLALSRQRTRSVIGHAPGVPKLGSGATTE